MANKIKVLIPTDICTIMSTEASFTIPKIQKQPRYPSIDECIEVWYTFTMEYYLVIKNRKKESLSFLTTWIDIEDTISKIS